MSPLRRRRLAALGCAVLAAAACVPLALALLAALELRRPPAAEPPQRAIVLVVWDSVDVLRLAPYGHAAARTPHLSRLAEEGTVFERHVPSSEGTNSALASLLTGLSPAAHGVGSLRTPGRQRLPGALSTLAELARARGFATLAAVSLPQLDAELSGLAQGFELWLAPQERGGEAAADGFEELLGALARELGRGRSVLVLLHEAALRREPAPRGPAAAGHARRALEPFAGRGEVGAALARLQGEPEAALDELGEALLRRRGDPARAALLGALYDGAVEELDGRLGQLLSVLEGRAGLRSVVAVTGSPAAAVGQAFAPAAGEPGAGPDPEAGLPARRLLAPLVVAGGGGHLPARVRAPTRDVDVGALLLGPGLGAPAASPPAEDRAPGGVAPFAAHAAAPGERRGAPVWDVELCSALVLVGAEAPGEPDWLVRLAPGAAPRARRFASPGQPPRAVDAVEEVPAGVLALAGELAREGGVHGRLELLARVAEPGEVVVRALSGRAELHAVGPGEPGSSAARPVVRFPMGGARGVEGGAAAVQSVRRAPDLALRLPVAEEARVRLGGRPLAELDAPLLAAPDGPPWPEGEPFVLDVRAGPRGGFVVELAAGAGERALLVLEALGGEPRNPPPVPLVRGAQGARIAPHPQRPCAVVVEGEGPLALELELPRGASLALAAFVSGERVPAARARWLGRRFAAGSLELALSACAHGDERLLGGDAGPSEPPPGGFALWLSDPAPPGGEVHPLPPPQAALVRRLGEGE